MKFKKGDRVEYIENSNIEFTKGKIYTVREDEFDKYGHLTIELDDKGSRANGCRPEYFKLIEENKMKTSKEVMVSVLRKAADNLENGLDAGHGIEYGGGDSWGCKEGFTFHANSIYRIKPETITLKNGVTIPKPIERGLIERSKEYFYPINGYSCYEWQYGSSILDNEILYAYLTKEQAIEASKALFGIE